MPNYFWGVNGRPFGLSLSLGTIPASTGTLRLANAGALTWRNAANTGDIDGITVNPTNQVVVGNDDVDIRWNKALVALGGGAAPTLGTIGGTGPATAGQDTWMRVIDSTGVAFWVPAWK